VKAKGAEVERLVAQLSVSKREYADAFLQARTSGGEMGGGRATSEDARQWARRNLDARGIPDSESIRWRLTALLGTAPVGSDD